MSLVQTEKVLVVPTEVLHRIGYFQGLTRDVDRYLDQLLCPRQMSYRARGEMEQDPNFKQLIPYVIFRHCDPRLGVRVFQYTRGAGQGEKRLHQKVSIGIGGHISSIDADGDDMNPYQEGMRRELDEEVIVDCQYRDQCVGLLNDDLTDVGKVHLGVVHIFDVEQPNVRPRESEILEAGFCDLDHLRSKREQMESWSRICFDAIF